MLAEQCHLPAKVLFVEKYLTMGSFNKIFLPNRSG